LDSLKDEPIIRLILDGTAVRVRLDKKNLDLFAQGTGPWPDRLYEELSADYRDMIMPQSRRSRQSARPSPENGS
jgi:hypothetical protein